MTARDLYEEGLQICYRIKDRRSVSQALTNLGSVANSLGNYAEARARYTESLAIKREVGIPRVHRHRLDGPRERSLRTKATYRPSIAFHEECLALCQPAVTARESAGLW